MSIILKKMPMPSAIVESIVTGCHDGIMVMRKPLLLTVFFLAFNIQLLAQTAVTDTGVEPDEMPLKVQSETQNAPSPAASPPSPIPDATSPEVSVSQSSEPLSPGHSKMSVLLIGDSMCDGLGSRFSDYAAKNGFELHTVIWYGSTSEDWATAYDLQYHIDRVRPDYVILSLGTNDLGYYDYARREVWIKAVIDKIGDIPYLWIGPLPWRKVRDRTIVDIIRRSTGEKNFYDSSNTYCQRLDGIHPTFPAAARWVDEIVEWMGNPAVISNPLPLERPDRKARFTPDEKHPPKYKGRRI